MKTSSIICGILVVAFASGCLVPQDDYDKLAVENEKLKTELDECKFGAERIVAAVEKAYAEKNYVLARQNIEMLYEKHPESPKNVEYKKLLQSILKKELVERRKKAAEEKERVRLANLNNTGMWSIRYYVDDFGDPTKDGYIVNTSLIRGTFSNSATQDSDLDVKLLISNHFDISLKLYEYAGNNPVKTSSPDYYSAVIQDKDGKRLSLRAVNRSDRLSFSKEASLKVHNALMKGGTLKFRITILRTTESEYIITTEYGTTHYEFNIQNADWYDNAYQKLTES